MKKMGQFVYKDHDVILWEETGSKIFEYGAIVVNEDGYEYETSTSTSILEVIERAITYIENVDYAPRIGM